MFSLKTSLTYTNLPVNILKFYNFHVFFYKNNILDWYPMQGWRILTPGRVFKPRLQIEWYTEVCKIIIGTTGTCK